MINNAPAKFQVSALVPGYTKALISHNVPTDFDLTGIVVYPTVDGTPQSYTLQPTAEGRTFFVMHDIDPNTSARFAFYDQMANDDALLRIAFGLNRSDPVNLTMLQPPMVTSVNVSSETVEVGTIPGEFTVNMSGSATNVIIQIKLVEDTEWTTKYTGAFSESINLGTIGDGTYNVRVMGTIVLNDGTVDQDSQWRVYGDTVSTSSATQSPVPVTNIRYVAMKKTTPEDNYDLKVSWDWARGDGGGVRAFLVQWRPKSGGEWAENTSVGTSIVLPDIPYNVQHEIEITSVPYGNTAAAKVTGEFKIHDTPAMRIPVSMTFADFSQDTDIKIGYRYIRTYSNSTGSRKLTFEIDAATGNMAIGAADDEFGGLPPITVNGSTGVLSINGRVITDKIHAATYELNWIDGAGSQPQFRTANKTSFGDPSDGIWMGYTDRDTFQFDIGNQNSYIRFDSDTGMVKMSANVVIEGNGNLGSYFETRYIAANSSPRPLTPTDRTPAGWSLVPPTPTGSQVVWQITARINADETLNTTWTTPQEAVLGADGKSAYELWLEQPGNAGRTMQEFLDSLQGASGTSGPGFFRWGVSGFTTWSTSHANAAMTALRGSTSNVQVGDVLTLYNSSNVSVAETRQWNGSAWVTAALVIHGNMIADGTIAARKIVANNAVFSSAGIDVIYNTGGNSSNYTMKIDLANGEIHIR